MNGGDGVSLYLKYRPTDLDNFMGNKPTVQALEAVLNKGEDIPRAMLFTGQSGCGKTTLARIVAKRLGCADSEFVEVDSASYRGIDSIREIRKVMALRPLAGKCKVWLLDEVHAATKDAQTALLKALEDTPKHVYFMLATTDPNKLLDTIIGRCMQFSVSPLPDRGMTKLLLKVLADEKKDVPEEVLNSIVKESLGRPRFALVLLDKVIDLPKERMLKAIDRIAEEEDKTIALCRALLRKDSWKLVREMVKDVEEDKVESTRRAVLGYCSSVLLGGDDPQCYLVMDSFRKPFYDNGKPGLIMACYEVLEA